MGIQFLPIAGLPKETDQGTPTTPGVGAYSLATLCWLLSAGVYIAAKAVATEMPPWTLCFWRVLLAGLILLPALRSHWTAVVSTVRQRWWPFQSSAGSDWRLQGLMYTGLNYTTAINAGLILALMPVITMILARLLLNEGRWAPSKSSAPSLRVSEWRSSSCAETCSPCSASI